jgi:hypothetical protein
LASNLEQLLVCLIDLVEVTGGVEELHGEVRGVLRVVALGGGDRREVQDALVAQVPKVADRGPVPPAERVEQHALAEREVRDDHLVDVELFEDLFEHERAAEDDVGALRIEPRHLRALLHGAGTGQRVDGVRELLRGQHGSADLLRGRLTPQGTADLGEVHDRAGRSDGHLEAGLLHEADDLRQVRPDVLAALRERPTLEGLVAQEALGEPDRAQLEAARLERLAVLPDHELRAPTTDVDEEVAPVEHRHGLQHPEVDETRLLCAGDDLHPHPRVLASATDELVPVLRLADGAGCDREHIGSRAVRDLAEAGERLDPPLDGLGREPLHVP